MGHPAQGGSSSECRATTARAELFWRRRTPHSEQRRPCTQPHTILVILVPFCPAVQGDVRRTQGLGGSSGSRGSCLASRLACANRGRRRLCGPGRWGHSPSPPGWCHICGAGRRLTAPRAAGGCHGRGANSARFCALFACFYTPALDMDSRPLVSGRHHAAILLMASCFACACACSASWVTFSTPMASSSPAAAIAACGWPLRPLSTRPLRALVRRLCAS